MNSPQNTACKCRHQFPRCALPMCPRGGAVAEASEPHHLQSHHSSTQGPSVAILTSTSSPASLRAASAASSWPSTHSESSVHSTCGAGQLLHCSFLRRGASAGEAGGAKSDIERRNSRQFFVYSHAGWNAMGLGKGDEQALSAHQCRRAYHSEPAVHPNAHLWHILHHVLWPQAIAAMARVVLVDADQGQRQGQHPLQLGALKLRRGEGGGRCTNAQCLNCEACRACSRF